ncbi:HTH-type transcriptional regulator DmlR [Labrenzia sp. THAF82]|uniref:LysR family transcriptional regulator n=1 Tax=Labrenzia sp. THAF82 TaxID=2587861 RepID=UPI001267FE26|nr:LysR family transcriptional regulator [Labrenzia sp. THAF82]QFT30707.1 HTH-type transcriptional regulator DmlR [Labrenzia sp. THAF82]
MSIDLKSLELFVRVAALGAIGKAGTEFGLSATAATQRLQALEATVGTQLFHRTTRAVSLSTDGEIFLAHAKRILGDVEEALADIQPDPRDIKGELRIACSASFGRLHIAPHVTEFLDRHPGVSLQLAMSDSVIDIVEQGIDIAIRIGALAPSTLKARKLAVSPRRLVAAPSYLERYGIPSSLDELKTHNCLAREDMRTWSLAAPDGTVHDIKTSGNFSSTSAEAITEAALSGLGIARKCTWEIADQLAAGALRPVLGSYSVSPFWKVFAVRPPSRLPSARVRAFTDFLESKLNKIPELCGD